MRDALPFFRSWLKQRREVASVVPSSRWTVRAVCEAVSREARQVVVEYGPGTGPLTRGLLKPGVLSADSKVIVIESNGELAAHLSRHLQDPRLTVVHDSAEHVRTILNDSGEEKADAVISGIPYSHFPDELRNRIVAATADILAPDGTHVVYQVRKAVEPDLRRHFASVRKKRVWLNIPPLHLFKATRNGINGSRTSA